MALARSLISATQLPCRHTGFGNTPLTVGEDARKETEPAMWPRPQEAGTPTPWEPPGPRLEMCPGTDPAQGKIYAPAFHDQLSA